MGRQCRNVLLKLLCLVVLAMPVGAAPYSTDPLSEEAVSYLELLDQGRYVEAWHEMSPYFQAIDQQDQWQNRQQAIRSAYGALEFRELFLVEYRDRYILSPDGQYVIVQFKTSFQYRASTTETVVLDCSTSPECTIREYIIR